MKSEVYRDNAGEWRWRVKAKNGRILSVSSEGYKRYASCIKCFRLVRKFFREEEK